jgi:RNA polymerase sigma-70 factor, ECF subfamily
VSLKPTKPQVDAQLIALAKNGDERAFEALFHAYERGVYSLCLRMTGDSSEAEDLTQDAFLQLFRRLSAFRNESAFATWLYRLVVNVVLMHFRKKRVQVVPFEQLDVSLEESARREYGADDRRLVGLIDRIIVLRALRQLPEGRRAILVLHDVEGYQHREIAQLLHCSIGNSKSQLCRARCSMRELLLSTGERRRGGESIMMRAEARDHRGGHPRGGEARGGAGRNRHLANQGVTRRLAA